MTLDTFAFKGNKAGIQEHFTRIQASNAHLGDETGSRPGWIMDRVRAAKPKRILEIGSQTGGITTHLLKVTPYVTCIDIVQNQLDVVAAMGAETHLCFVEELHWLDIGRFDVVLMTEVLNHAVDADLAMANAWGKVVENGHLILTVPYGDRWVDKCTSHRFDSDEDLARLIRIGTGLRSSMFVVEGISAGGELYFYACDVCKPSV